jgi:DNA-binding IclR family transcriptional regulator
MLLGSEAAMALGRSTSTDRAEQTDGVKSTFRALLVLETLTDGQARSLSELAATLSLPKSSLHGILRTMVARDWLTVDGSGTQYSLGVRTLITGQGYLSSDSIVRLADPVLDSLVAALDETIHFGLLSAPDIVWLAKRDCSHPLRLVSAVGRRMPAHATALGKVLLAEQPDDLALSQLAWPLPRLTDSTITSRRELVAELARTRQRGHAVDAGESTVGLRCFAVAVRTSKPARYAISCSIPEPRIDPSRAAIVVKELLAARDALEARASLPCPSTHVADRDRA